jgi:hypothetical protein
MKTINEFISTVITEASLDARIPDGMVNLKNTDHLQVVAEAMYDACGDEGIVNEFVESFMDEGKYPDRQAYNKDGWLVTFPSAEYKKRAIKKGTHYASDPTHGKGGMNLYYKKRGKQKRQTQQVATATQQTEPMVAKPSVEKKPTTAPSLTKTAATEKPDAAARSSRLASLMKKSEPSEKPVDAQAPTKEPTTSSEPSTKSDTTAEPSPETPKTAEAPAIDVPVVSEPPVKYADVSKKFAAKKEWRAEPYGEYRDGEGNPVAVVGLSGEVVPIRNNDREEYKIFAEKSNM